VSRSSNHARGSHLSRARTLPGSHPPLAGQARVDHTFGQANSQFREGGSHLGSHLSCGRASDFARAPPRLCPCPPQTLPVPGQSLPVPASPLPPCLCLVRFGSSSSPPFPSPSLPHPVAFAGAYSHSGRSVLEGGWPRPRSHLRRASSSRSSPILPPDPLNNSGATAFDLTTLYWELGMPRTELGVPAPCHPTPGISLDRVLGRLLCSSPQRTRNARG
jgi:hypothetical protein